MFRSILTRSMRASALPKVLPARPVMPVSIKPMQPIRFYAGFPPLTRELARERIIELLEGYEKVPEKEITESSHFLTDLGLDSLDVVEVVMELEHEFNIQIPDQEADSLKTVGQAVDYILAQPDAC